MKNIIAVVIVFITLNAKASELKPGLWEIKMKMTRDGKEFDPMAEVMKELEKMPEAQKKMILEQLKKDSSNSNLTQVCYTEEMLKDRSKLETREDEQCKYVEQNKTPKKVIATFKCNDGRSGTSVWEMKDSNHMSVVIDAKDKKGKSERMEYTSKFIKSSCK